jgi:shikimate dehydrogenase
VNDGTGPDRYAVIGWPLAHTRSPDIHAMFAAQTGQHIVYEAIPVPPASLSATLEDFFAAGGRGLNVTVPHKEAVLAHCEVVTERARTAGAANTLWREPGRAALGADNTDGAGLVRDLEHNLGVVLAGKRIVMLGAGGAARGVAGPLLDSGCAALTVVNRTASRAATLVEQLRTMRAGVAWSATLRGGGFDLLDDDHGERADILINATSAGLDGEMPPVPGRVATGAFCYDMLYGEDTPFAAWARANGADDVALGFGMLVEQAAESFSRWRGVRPDTGPVIKALA